MENNLLGYLLNALDAETHQQVETQLRADSELQHSLGMLRQALEPLAADKEEIDPPAGLAYRTIARVAEYRCRPLPPPPERSPAPPMPHRRWRQRDILIAASILVLVSGMLVPMIAHVRDRRALAGCQNNLRQVHDALAVYRDNHAGNFPMVQEEPPYNFPGMFAVHLKEAGCLGTDQSGRSNINLLCPANGGQRQPEYTSAQLMTMSPEERARAARELTGCYAYSLGYRGPSGELCGLRQDIRQPDLTTDRLPILADKPRVSPGSNVRGNSLNHAGQNVLYMGGNVRYWTTPNAGIDDDDIYLNRDGKVAAGKDLFDTVLGTGNDEPGKLPEK
jgi:hypothetical protein